MRDAAAASAGAKAVSSYCKRLVEAPLVIQICEASAATTLPVKLKICLGLYQLIAQFGDVYQIRYPADYESASSTALAPLRGNLFSWIPGLHLRCFGVRRSSRCSPSTSPSPSASPC